MDDYKSSKEAFVSGLEGSTVMHVNLISTVALTSLSLYASCWTRLPARRPSTFFSQWLILVLPLLLSMTSFAERPGTFSLLLFFPTLFLVLRFPQETNAKLPSNEISESASLAKDLSSNRQTSRLAPLTVWRAHMMLMTILAILAVDFPLFPRNLAKCETYGVSLMDLGVGSFVFSQGVVSAIPLIKDPAQLVSSYSRTALSGVRKSLPVIFLGSIRVLLVKASDYPEHITEYGVHWNFFITLALLPVLQVTLYPIIRYAPIVYVGLSLSFFHQTCLSYLGWEQLVLYAPRSNLFSANKEGLVSLLGYLSIHMLGLSSGTLLLPPSPSTFKRKKKILLRTQVRKRRNSDPKDIKVEHADEGQRQNDKTVIELLSYAILWWALFGLLRFANIDSGVSRQMANISYIIWIVAFNTTWISFYFLIDLYFFPSPFTTSVYSPASKRIVSGPSTAFSVNALTFPSDLSGSPPSLLEAINKNSLAIFLLANIFTGVVNMSVQTMFANDVKAMIILLSYSLAVCLVAWVTRDRKILPV